MDSAAQEIKVGDLVQVKSYAELLEILEKSGRKECSRGNWHLDDRSSISFYFNMFDMFDRVYPVTHVGENFVKIDCETFLFEWVTKL